MVRPYFSLAFLFLRDFDVGIRPGPFGNCALRLAGCDRCQNRTRPGGRGEFCTCFLYWSPLLCPARPRDVAIHGGAILRERSGALAGAVGRRIRAWLLVAP